jgi:hypothetical protein
MKSKLIKSVEIELDGITIKVTPEQALKLYDALGELLGKNVAPVVIKEKEYIPMPYPAPTPIWPRRPIIWEYQQPWYTTTGGTTLEYKANAQACKITC